MKKLLPILLIFSLIGSSYLFSQNMKSSKAQFFIENKGQWDSDVLYLAQLGGLNLWITKSGVVYDYYQIEKNKNMKPKNLLRKAQKSENEKIRGHIIRSHLLGINNDITTQTFDKSEAYHNYFKGNNPKEWVSFVPLYGSVQLNNVYNGIDIRYYYENNRVRYDWIIHPNADANRIKIKFEGQDGIIIASNGDLILQTSLGEVEHCKSFAYQMENGKYKAIECKFNSEGSGVVSFDIGRYNKNEDLVIDPLVYSTFLGGTAEDYITNIAMDHFTNAYLTGYTMSSDYPISIGAYNNDFYNVEDIFVTKLNIDGSNYVYSTFICGSYYNSQRCEGIAVDSSGCVYLTGWTSSKNYPFTHGCFDSTFNYYKAFVTKLNESGSALIYSTLLGGSGTEAKGIAIDKKGCAYITGITYSSDFPTTPGCYNPTFQDSGDVFITKLNETGSSLVYSTLICGTGYYQYSNGIALDSLNNAYIVGYAETSDFPTTAGSWCPTYNGEGDVFVLKIDTIGSSLLYSTFLGGSPYKNVYGIAVDKFGCAYITGYTTSSDFPTTHKCWDSTFNGLYNVFITKINETGSDLVYSTYLGGTGTNYGFAITTDEQGNAIVVGSTDASDFPITQDAYENSYIGNDDAFFTILNSDGSNLLYSTFLSGSNIDRAYGVSFYNNIVIVCGITYSPDFPTTDGAFDKFYNKIDGFVTKFDISTLGVNDIQNCSKNSITLSEIEPNPSSDIIRFTYSICNAQNIKIAIYNILGERVMLISDGYQIEGMHNDELNISQLPSGAYYIQIVGNTEQVNQLISIVK